MFSFSTDTNIYLIILLLLFKTFCFILLSLSQCFPIGQSVYFTLYHMYDPKFMMGLSPTASILTVGGINSFSSHSIPNSFGFVKLQYITASSSNHFIIYLWYFRVLRLILLRTDVSLLWMLNKECNLACSLHILVPKPCVYL